MTLVISMMVNLVN